MRPADPARLRRYQQSLIRRLRRNRRTWRRLLGTKFGDDQAGRILDELEAEFAELAPEIPWIGGRRNLMTPFIEITYLCLALYLVLKRRGHDVETIGCFLEEIYRPPLRWLPDAVRRRVFRLLWPMIKAKLRSSAAWSKKHPYPEDFRWDFVEGDGTFDAGIDVTDCAICRICARHGAEEITPYMCAVDDKMSAALDLGLQRTGTRAVGAERCDFRFTPGGAPRTLRSQYSLSPKPSHGETDVARF